MGPSWREVGLISLLLLAANFGLTAPASAQATSAVITGTITDAQGGVLPGVTLTVRNTETGTIRTSVSESDGRYRVPGLPPGRYDLKAELAGFASVDVRELTLTLGLEAARNITMQLAGVQESLTVSGQAPMVETTKTDVSGVITQQQIESLPLVDVDDLLASLEA